MGVIIPFPGSGSRSEGHDSDGPAGVEAQPDVAWAVPGIDPDPSADVSVEQVAARAGRRAENVGLAVLTAHDASEGEVRARLVRAGVDADEIERELDRLRRTGLVDDEAFAARLIDRLRTRKGLGDGAVRAALRQRLVPPSIVDRALFAAAEEPESVRDRLQEVASDRARRLGGLAPEVAERRLLAYLQRRGYGGAEARDAARDALGRS